jgi:predicted AAA+ superfamily ATPase
MGIQAVLAFWATYRPKRQDLCKLVAVLTKDWGSMLLDRPLYSNWLTGYEDKPVVKVLTGLRRCGKSSLLLSTAERLRAKHGDDNVVHLNFELFANSDLLDSSKLSQHLEERLPAHGKLYVLLDEVQLVEKWEHAVNSLFAQGRVDIYITGSNSTLLSSELGTLLTGRYVSLEVSTLSFAEHLQFSKELLGKVGETKAEFSRYLARGGFPGLYAADYDDNQVAEIVGDMFHAIIARDVLTRHPVRNPELFERITRFALWNVGNVFSARSVADYMKSQRRTLSHNTVSEYLGYLEEAFIIARVRRNDLSRRRILATNEKFFAGDHGLVTALFAVAGSRVSGLLENIVYAELRRRGYSVTIGKQGDKEIDFVADRSDERLYVQVAATILDDTTREREYAPLRAIADSYPKYVLSLDTLPLAADAGIIHCHVADFLLAAGGTPQ